MIRIAVIFLFTLLISSQQIFAENKSDIFGVPFVIYSPETSFSFGAAGYYYNIPDGDTLNSADELDFYAMYTLREQFLSTISYTDFLIDEKFKFYIDLHFSKFPDNFYGIGPNSQYQNEERYTALKWRLKLSFLKRFEDNFMIGPSYRLVHYNILNTEEGGIIDNGDLVGDDISISSGIGFETVWDKRDQVFYPLKGFRIDGDIHYYPKLLGSDYEFSRFNLFVSTFHNLYKKQVLAFNSELNLTSGTVPFQMLPKAGSQNNMRGIYEGRFIDNNHFSIQTEYRIPLFYRFGLNLFGGVANVSNKISRFRLNNFVPAYGVGIRFNLKKSEHLNLRLDVANSEDGIQFYFNIKEAF